MLAIFKVRVSADGLVIPNSPISQRSYFSWVPFKSTDASRKFTAPANLLHFIPLDPLWAIVRPLDIDYYAPVFRVYVPCVSAPLDSNTKWRSGESIAK